MKPSLLALLGSVAYATARYNIFKGVPWNDWPTYTLNKALGLSTLVLLVFAVIRKGSADGHSIGRTLGMASVFASMHVLLSLTLLSPVNYENLFLRGRLTGAAGLSMLLGAVAAAVMAAGKTAHETPDANRGGRNLAVLALVVGLHAALQGVPGWFAPSNWPGLMPPITLISFLLGLAAVAIAARGPRR